MRRVKLALLGIAAVILTALAVPAAHAAATPAAAPTASQLLAKANHCMVVSKSKYKTDDETSATVNICQSGSAYVWKADMDVDCDGVASSVCNSSTDPWYQGQTSFPTSKGKSFTASTTHYYVIPLPSSKFSYKTAGIKPGTVAAIVYQNKVLYAVFADEGPSNIIGEASYATARDLGIDPDPENGGTDSGVTYIVLKGNVPSPVEDNATITAKGRSAAAAWLNS